MTTKQNKLPSFIDRSWFFFSFPIFYVAITQANRNHPQEESAKFGYRFEMKVKTSQNPANFGSTSFSEFFLKNCENGIV
jgi:hypothetical protein